MDEGRFYALLRRMVALPVALLVCLAAILAVEIALLSSSLRWVDHSDQVIAGSRQLFRYIAEMDTSLRGYALTGNEGFLEPYEEARTRVPEQLDFLAQLIADNPGQQERLRILRESDRQWVQWADQHAYRGKQGPVSASAMLEGQHMLDSIREQQRVFIAEEERLRVARSRHAKILNASIVGTAVGLSLIIAVLLFTLTRRELLALSTTYERHLQAEADQRRQLSESREWFQSTLNSLGEAVISTGQYGIVSYINPAAQQLTGWSHSDAIGRKFSEVLHLTDERTQLPAEDPVEMVRRAKQVVTLSGDLLLRSQDGTTVPIDLTGAPVLGRHGEVVGITMVFRDVTQRRQTEQTLRTSERLTLAGRLSATIAHEIRNPLDTVANLVYLLQHDKTEGMQTQYLSLAGEEIARISQITGQLLTFHRESRSPVAVDLSEVMESVLALFAPQIKLNRIAVVKRLETHQPVRGYPGELRQVFSNLVGNAIEAVVRGGTLVLHTRESSSAQDPAIKGVRVTVMDSGAGIPPGIRKNLFAPFYTTKGEKGTGLGLWISRGIVEKHEGTIHLISRTRNGMSGTAFSVFLPFEQKLGLLEVSSVPPV